MEENKYTYEQLLNVLKTTQPILNNKDELTGIILSRLKEAREKEEKKRYRFLFTIRWVSGIAGVILICGFITETFSFASPSHGYREDAQSTPIVSAEYPKREAIIGKENFGHNIKLSEKTEVLQTIIDNRRKSKNKYNRILSQTKFNINSYRHESK